MTVEDPESLEPVTDAFCVMMEIHTSFKTKALVVLFECWRSKEAFDAEKRSFHAIRVPIDPDKGGRYLLDLYAREGAIPLGGLTNFCLNSTEALQGGTLAAPPKASGDE